MHTENHKHTFFYRDYDMMLDKIYCINCLWKTVENLPKSEISIDLIQNIDTIEWDKVTVDDALHPITDEEKMHYGRIIFADISYPIILILIDGEYHIVDGCHRFVKSVKLLKRNSVKCIIVTWNILTKCLIYIKDIDESDENFPSFHFKSPKKPSKFHTI